MRFKWIALASAAAVIGTSVLAVAATPPKPAAVGSTIIGLRRTTETQYRHAVADNFGADIKVVGRFEPEARTAGLLAVGSKGLSISAAGFEQYYAMAASVADQALDEKHRAQTVGCEPKAVAKDACSEAFIRKTGRALFRRPLSDAEVASRMDLIQKAKAQGRDAYGGLKLVLASMLVSPDFLFRTETAEADPKDKKALRLDGYTKAARLSYLLWDASPDDELLRAAETGEIQTEAGLTKQVERLMASPRLEDGVRAFFTDMLQLSYFETLNKDAAIYPKFSAAVAKSAKEETLKVVVDHLLTKDADYRDLVTTRDTFVDRSLAAVYRVLYAAPSGWARHTFAEEDGRSGLLTQVTFLSLFSHPGRSSPTKRGVALNEIFLCTETPPAPANVDFSIVNDVSNPNLKTVRARLLAHATDEACNFCHVTMDPIGLSLEQFDSLGERRLMENGDKIDVSSELSGKKFDGAVGLGRVLRENPRLPACFVRNIYAYGVGHEASTPEDKAVLTKLNAAFAQDNYRAKALIRQLVTSDDFFRPTLAKPDAEPVQKDRKVAGAKQPKATSTAGGLQ